MVQEKKCMSLNFAKVVIYVMSILFNLGKKCKMQLMDQLTKLVLSSRII